MAYRLNEETGIIDYDMLEKTAQLYRPKLLVAGASAYPRYSAPKLCQLSGEWIRCELQYRSQDFAQLGPTRQLSHEF